MLWAPRSMASQMSISTALTIFGMALVTYATRAGGLWLMDRVRVGPRVETWLRHIPGAILVAIVAPMIVESGPAELVAVGVTIAVGATTKSVLLTMVAGVAAVIVARALLP